MHTAALFAMLTPHHAYAPTRHRRECGVTTNSQPHAEVRTISVNSDCPESGMEDDSELIWENNHRGA